DRAGHPVVDLVQVDQPAPEDLPDGLLSQANAQNAFAGGKPADDLLERAGLVRKAGTWGKDDIGKALHLLQAELVVPPDGDLAIEILQIMNQIVGETIIVVDHQYFCSHGSDCFREFKGLVQSAQ